MAASALEDGARSQKQGRRGCEHYDRGCLLKVTTSMGSSLQASAGPGGGGVGKAVRLGLKLEAKLFVRLPSPPRIGFRLWRTFWQGDHRPHLFSCFTLRKQSSQLGKKELELAHQSPYQWVYLVFCYYK